MKRIMAWSVLLFITVYSLIATKDVFADDRGPKIVISGFQDYKTFGSTKALLSWLKYGPHEGSNYSKNLIETMSKAENLYGDYKDYEIMNKFSWSNNVIYYFIVINYDKGPLFTKFMLYKYRNDWVIYGIEMNSNPEIIMPDFYFNRRGSGGL